MAWLLEGEPEEEDCSLGTLDPPTLPSILRPWGSCGLPSSPAFCLTSQNSEQGRKEDQSFLLLCFCRPYQPRYVRMGLGSLERWVRSRVPGSPGS